MIVTGKGHIGEKEDPKFAKVQLSLPVMKHVDHFEKVDNFLFCQVSSLCHIAFQEHLDGQKASSAII